MLELGGYFNEADFNQLEVWGYQNLYLRGGPIPTAEGQVSIQAGSSLGGGTVINWQNCLRTFPWVREEWAREHGLEGVDGPDYDRYLDQVMERIGATDSCSELNGPHQRLKEGCEALGWDFKLITRNVDPARHDPDLAGYVGFGDVTGSKLSGQKTYLADAARARRRPGRQLPRRADPGRGWARGGGRGHATPAPTAPRRGSWFARRRSSSPAARSSRPRSCGARGSAAPPSATTCACIRPGPCSPPTTSRRTAGGARRSPRSPISSRRAATGTASCSRAPTTRSGSPPPRCPGSPGASTRRRSPGSRPPPG